MSVEELPERLSDTTQGYCGLKLEKEKKVIHARVKARSILLVLEPSLGQVNGKHTGHSD